ncbi:peroxiredoxin [bacterium]|nr:peroxiredoxin [bacterium]
MNIIKEGDRVPAFSLPADSGEEIRHDSYPGKWIVLYLYPKDNTSGCTLEAADFSALAKDFTAANGVILGVSPDSVKSHCNFISKHSLSIPLLSDPEHRVIETFNAWVLKKMYGREYYGVERSTFLIDPEGYIRHIWRKVNVKGHAAEVLATLKQLQH